MRVLINRMTLAGLAAAGSSGAMAQSSVEIFGRINTTLERQKTGDVTTTGLFNNRSSIGFRGTEDLGGGLRAGFVLEADFNSDDGSGRGGTGIDFRRQSEVNLSGHFGSLRLGSMPSESYIAMAAQGVMGQPNHDLGSLSDALYYYPMPDANKVAYRTPVLWGRLTVEGASAFHENGENSGNKNGYDLTAKWAQGPLSLATGVTKVHDSTTLGLHAQYTFDAFRIGAYYQRTDEDLRGKRNAGRVTALYSLGLSDLIAGFGWAGNWSGVGSSSARQLILGYNYHLSLRTKVYAGYTRVDNKANARYATGTDGADFSTFALGIRHHF